MQSPRARILLLQEARCKAYEEWEAAFRRFIAAGAEEEPYAQVIVRPSTSRATFAASATLTCAAPPGQACKGATTEFARISAAIRAVEEELKADSGDGAGLAHGDGAGLAQWVRKLQQAEQSKLQLTIGTQVAVFCPCCAALRAAALQPESALVCPGGPRRVCRRFGLDNDAQR